jgi:uncharacterized membrane-anchored protein YhcB (DUF1043 family)
VIILLSAAALSLSVGFLLGILYGAHILTGHGRLKDHISEEMARLRSELKKEREQFLKKF